MLERVGTVDGWRSSSLSVGRGRDSADKRSFIAVISGWVTYARDTKETPSAQ